MNNEDRNWIIFVGIMVLICIGVIAVAIYSDDVSSLGKCTEDNCSQLCYDWCVDVVPTFEKYKPYCSIRDNCHCKCDAEEEWLPRDQEGFNDGR